MRTPIIAGNWKMNRTPSEAAALARNLRQKISSIRFAEVVIAPTFVCLPAVAQVIDDCPIRLAAQNVFWESHGAFTGEVSASMLKDIGCRYVILGHSERRQYFQETDEAVSKRARATLDHGMAPILCIGETLQERESNQTLDILKKQLLGGLTQVADDEASRLVIAYEPVWAIGTGRTASPQQAQDAHAFIRKTLSERFSPDAAQAIRLQYGGSVNAKNAQELLSQPDIDGALVGGASLDPDAFLTIIRASQPA
jgi:triosephosphate isomerase (TIM)